MSVCCGPSVNVTSFVASLGTTPINFSPYITGKTTHYVTCQSEVEKNTTKVLNAKRRESFLHDCIACGSIVDASPYLLTAPTQTNDISIQSSSSMCNWSHDTFTEKRALDPNRKREVKIFISSTFRDMADERSLLVSKIFPQIDNICKQRNVTFSFVDLRWGIRESDAKDDKGILKCLKGVDACRPYFIGFLGERYGWAQNDGFGYDENLNNAFRKASVLFPWINKYKDRSISELEMIYAALQPELSPLHKIPADGKSYPRSFFFFRDPLSITKRFELGDPERKNYEEDSSDGHRKLRELKDRIRASSLPLVDGYNIENLSHYLMDCLKAVIEQDFPADEDAAKQTSLIQHQNVSVFHRSDSVYRSLQSCMSENGSASLQAPVVLYGPEGSGKATHLIHWLQERLENTSIQNETIISYFIRDRAAVLPHLCAEEIVEQLSSVFDISAVALTTSRNEDDIRISLFSIFDAIGHQLRKKQETLILALPGSHLLRSLAWLPEQYPTSIRIFLTCKSFSTSPSPLHLLARDKNPTVKRAKSSRSVTIPPWIASDKENFIKEYLKMYSKKLEGRYIKQLLQSHNTANPLFLKIVLDQLIHTGSFDNLGLSLSRYLSARNCRDLFGMIIADWQLLFHTEAQSTLVTDVLGFLALSHAGLSEEDLIQLTNCSPELWAPFFYTLKYFTRTSPHGFLLYHQSLSDAIQSRFQGNTKQQLLCRLQRYLETQPLDRSIFELPFILLDLSSVSVDGTESLRRFLSQPEHIVPLYESLLCDDLVILWKATGTMSLTAETITSHGCSVLALDKILSVAEQMRSTEEIAMLVKELMPLLTGNEYRVLFAKYLELNGNYEEASDVLSFIDQSSSSVEELSTLGVIRKKQGRYEEAAFLYQRCMDYAPSQASVAKFKLLLGDIERKQEHFDKALQLYQEVFCEYRDMLGEYHLKIVDVYRNIGLLHKKRAEYSDAKSQYAKALHILEQKCMGKGKQYAFIVVEIADVYRKTGEYDTARALYESAVEMIETCCGSQHPEIAEVLNSYGILLKKQGKYTEALPLYERSLEIIRNTFGDQHYKYAVCLNNLGDLQRKTGNFDRAIEIYQQAQGILGATVGYQHTEYAEVSNNIGIVYKKQGKYSQARKAYEKALRIVFNEYGAVHVKVGIFLANLADVFRKENNHTKALQVYDQAEVVICRCLGAEDVEIGDILQNRALVFIDLQQFDDAKMELDMATYIVEKRLGKDHPKNGYCLHKRGILAHETGDLKKAETFLKESLQVLYKSLDQFHPEVADVLITLGEVQSKGNSAAALQSFRSALQIIFFCFGKEHYKYKSVCNAILKLGGSIPEFQKQETSKKGSTDWRKTLNNLIATSTPSTESPSKASSSTGSNAQLIFMAMTNGWM